MEGSDMAQAPRLYRVILQASDIEQAARFYARLLGAEGRRVSPGRHYFDCGDVILAVFDPQADGDNFDARPNPDHVYFAVDDLNAIYQRALEAKAEILEEIRTQPWGERCFYMKDPIGNPLCFVDASTVFTGR
jgi:uncharacterized glyoxalase superfamily protein PhnB